MMLPSCKGKKKQQKKTPGDNESQETSASQSLESSASQSREPSASQSLESSASQSQEPSVPRSQESSTPQSQDQQTSSKGRKKKQRDSHTPQVEQQQQSHEPQVEQQPGGPPMQQPRGPQMQQPRGPPMQQPRGPQMQQPRGPPMQQPRGPQMQQQAWGPQVQQQQQPQGPQVEQQPGGPPMQQPRGPQMQQPRGPPMQQPRGPPMQQPGGPPMQQPRGPQMQQPGGPPMQQPRGPPMQQPRGPPMQQPRGPQMQQPGGPPMQQPRGPPMQQPRGPPMQQPRGPQMQQRAWGPQVQQQQQPQEPQVQQQQQPQGPQVQQQQQPQGPQVLQQQQQPKGAKAQQQQPQGPPVQQQQQQQRQQQQQKSQVKQQQQPQSAKAQQHQPPPIESLSLSPVGVQKSKVSMPSHLMESYLEQIPKRTNLAVCGKAGTPIFVETNMFRIVFGSKFQTNVIHYDVAMDPDRPKQLMRPVFEQFRKKHFPKRYPAYDGKKNAYSANDLPFGDTMEDSVEVFDNERQQLRTYKVKLTKAAVVDLSWLKSVKPGSPTFQNGIQALDVILRHGPSSAMVTVGRSLFQQPTGRVVSLSSGLDLWVGVFQSAVIGWKPYLNVDVAHKGFPSPQNVIDLMKELCQNPRYNDNKEVGPADIRRNETKITKFLKGLKVQYEIPGQSKRTQRVNGLGECAKTNKFTLSNGKVCTVQQYFAQEKRYNIRFPELPCLWIGSREKKIYVPAELCTIVAGQVVQKKMDEVQTSKMVREAATDTNTRKEKIKNGFASLRLNESPVVTNEFQLSVQGQFEKVPARVLSPPVLQYHGREVRVSRGVWHAGHFYSPSKLDDKTWTILNLNDRYTQDRDMYFLLERLQQAGNSVNIKIGSAQTPFTTLSSQGPRYVQNIQKYFQDKKDEGLQLVVVIIPDHVDAYSKVKQITELRVGVLTQCIRAQTLRKLSDATVTNILLKINSKLNGVNHIFGPRTRPRCLESPCILIGADVTHPSPDAIDVPSIAAVAASHDPSGTKYNIEIRLQPPREEMILDLEEIMREQLIFFYKKTNHKPNKIIFYRDGVGDGHLPAVMHFELQAIKRACQRLQADYNPPVTFLVVQKRHHIRLFPTDRKYSDDRNFNVQAGTIVDTEITHPSHIDFYLVSHASIQGTARPTKYKCICNENKMSEDEIEQLTYYLCHIFARCTRSVSYPAPTYYAHLAAFRARALTHEVHLQLDNLKEEQRTKMNLQIHKTTPMFFV